MPPTPAAPIRRSTPVGEVMNRQVISVQLESKASLADQLMKLHAIHHVPVLEGKILRGIVSQTDLYKNMLSYFLIDSEKEQQQFLDEQLDLNTLMSVEPLTLEPEQTVGEALDLMIEYRVGSIPVVNAQNELLGIVTDYDMLKWLGQALK